MENPPSTEVSWTFIDNKHVITLGLDFDAPCAAGISDRQRVEYAQSLLRHEADHALFTFPQSMPDLCRWLQDCGVPFRLFNLFEDARIEHLDREEHKRTHPHKPTKWFRWRNWTPAPSHTSLPEVYFWAMINAETSHRSRVYPPDCKWAGTPANKSVIADFYRKACKAAKPTDLLPLCAKWLELFGRPSVTVRGSDNIGGTADPSTTGTAGSGYSTGGSDPSDAEPEPLPADLESGPSLTADEERDVRYWYRPGGERKKWSVRNVRGLITRLTGLVHRAGHRRTQLSTSGSHLHIPGIMVGAAQSFRSIKADAGRRCLTLVMDMSGSMASPLRMGEALELMLALMALHRRGLLVVNIWLTGQGKTTYVNPCWPASWIIPIHHFSSSEGVKATLEHAGVREHMHSSDVTVVYTDGDLTDGTVDAGELRRKGVDLIGALVCDNEADRERRRPIMARHFGRAALALSGDELASQLVTYTLAH